MKRKFAVLCASTLIALSIASPTPAHARPFAGVVRCNADFSFWPGFGTGGCDGTFDGVDVADPGHCLTGCPFFMRIDNHSEVCIAGEPPLIGFSNGELLIDDASAGNFSATRIGLTVLLIPPDAASVMAFVPLPPIPTCEAPGHLNAVMAGPVVSL